jgi:polysaccharide deacetylase family protein (PEP-CTERM system associated)
MNALSFDVEDYFQVEGFADCVELSDWDSYTPRVIDNTRRILDLLRSVETRATFFVLGWVADRFPELVSEIARDGHELATHGYWHQPVQRQTREQFSQDIADSITAIKNALRVGEAENAHVCGYRAPTFSITNDTLWALDALREQGIVYDSSIFPLAAHDRYGISDAPRFAHRRNGIWEFPLSTVRVASRNLPIGGGGYFRLLPLQFTSWGFKKVNAEGHSVVFYLHPWELDPDQPVVDGASRSNKFRHYVNLSSTEKKLRRLLKVQRFGPIREVFARQLEESLCASR